MRPPSAARTRIALGLILAAILALVAALHVRDRGERADANRPTAPAAAGGAPMTSAGRAVPGLGQPDPGSGTLQLAGTTIDDQLRPIGGVRVTVNGARTTASTDAGWFAFDGLAPGQYELTAERGAAYGEASISLDDSSGPSELRLRFAPTLVIHVVDRAGAAVAGAKVRLANGLDRITDRDGKATVRGQPGRVWGSISAPGHASLDLDIAIGEDPRDTIERTVVLGPTAPIGGVVIDQTGAPVPYAYVYVKQADQSWSDNTETDDQGRWRLDGFGPGKLKLTASTADTFSEPEALVGFDATAPRLDLVIHAERGATIDVVVVDAAGQPAPGAHVIARTQSRYSNVSGNTDDRGRVSLRGAGPGEFTVEAWIEALAAPSQTVVLPRAGHADLAFRLVESAIAGTVTSPEGAPVANASVIAQGASTTWSTTDDTGHFVLHDVAVGEYSVFATRDSASDRDLGFADHHAVTAHSGDRDVKLVLADAAWITGRVVLDGRPVEFFGVAPDPSLIPAPQHEPDGRFELEVETHTADWPELRHLVLVGPGFQRKVIEGVFAGPGQTTDLGDIAVTAGKTVRGRVITASGAPVAGATVVVQAEDVLQTELSLGLQGAGSRGARSDASGQFEITGLPDDASGLLIQAQHPARGQALPRTLTVEQLAGGVELVLAATGAVSGSVIGEAPGAVRQVVVVSRAEGRVYEAHAEDGAFSIAQLPAGDYTASLGTEPGEPAVAFHVDADRTTEVALTTDVP